MFAALDTNHLSELARNSERGNVLRERIAHARAEVFGTIVTAQEVFQGWFNVINRHQAGRDQIRGYAQFHNSFDLLSKLTLLPFDDQAAEHFHQLQRARIRIGTMDLKIAAICLSHGAMLLTRNLVDFEKVPGLRAENWLD